MRTSIKTARFWMSPPTPDYTRSTPDHAITGLWDCQYSPHDEEVFLIRASDLEAHHAQVVNALGVVTVMPLFPLADAAMDALGLVSTPPRRKGRKAR